MKIRKPLIVTDTQGGDHLEAANEHVQKPSGVANVRLLELIASGFKPLAVTVGQAQVLSNVGPTKLWELIASGVLQSVKVGRRRLIVYRSLEALLCPASAAVSARRRGRPRKSHQAASDPPPVGLSQAISAAEAGAARPHVNGQSVPVPIAFRTQCEPKEILLSSRER